MSAQSTALTPIIPCGESVTASRIAPIDSLACWWKYAKRQVQRTGPEMAATYAFKSVLEDRVGRRDSRGEEIKRDT